MSNPIALDAAAHKPGTLTRRAYLLLSLVITLLSCSINFPGVTNTEVIDDHDLLHNVGARGCGRNPLDCFRHAQFGLYYRPLMGASFSVGENLHGQRPLPFHVENIVGHGIVVLLSCWLFRLVLQCDRAALFASLVYGIHPLQVPVTTFIGGRTDTIALVFLFSFVIGTIKSAEGRAAFVWRAVSLFAFTGAIFTKEQCIPLVAIVPLLTLLKTSQANPLGRASKPFQLWMALYLVPIAALLIAAHRVIPPTAIDTVGWKASSTQVAWDLALRIEMIGRTLCYYMKCYLWPTPATLHQCTLGPWDTPQPLTALAGFFTAGIWLAITRHCWPDRRLRTLSLWVVLTLTPCLNLVPIPSQFIGCYRAAIPLFGLAGLAGALFARFTRPDSSGAPMLIATAVTSATAALLTILSFVDAPLWNNDLILTKTQFAADPNFLPALAGYAMTQRYVGQKIEALITNDRVMSRLFPTQTTLEQRIAVIDTPWMLRHVKSQSSLRYQPRAFVNYVMRERGGGAQDLGLYTRAIEDYKLALAVTPYDVEVSDALIVCYERSGRTNEAVAVLEELVKRAPNSSRLRRLGDIYLHMNRWSEAKEKLARALSLAMREHNPKAPAILRDYQMAEALVESQEHDAKGTRTVPPTAR